MTNKNQLKLKEKTKDKLLIGLQAGVIATCFKEVGSITSILIKAQHSYFDYSSVLIFQHLPQNFGEYFLAIIIQIFFSITLAVGYSYIEVSFPTKYYLLKGGIFGGQIWFVLQGIILLYKITPLAHHSIQGTIVEFLTAIVFGIITSWWVNKKNN